MMKFFLPTCWFVLIFVVTAAAFSVLWCIGKGIKTMKSARVDESYISDEEMKRAELLPPIDAPTAKQKADKPDVKN